MPLIFLAVSLALLTVAAWFRLQLMRQIKDWLRQEDVDVAALNSLIQNFQRSHDTLTASDSAALDAIAAASEALASKSSALRLDDPSGPQTVVS